ncbi:hypothetical protein RLOC_00014470 [Lonchura striata]|uniref:Uncharacterized protein n=1 Tax=Lonchura striata TaxID=40157 RepID=A0A218V550_9PASE|nr:hypothetical protein RLOC_00014470 [Lonchura striata domestica]
MTDLRSVHTVPSQSLVEQGTLHSTPAAAEHSATTPGARPSSCLARLTVSRSCHHNQHMMPEPGWPQQSTLVPSAMAWSHQPGHCGGHSPGDCSGDT